MKRSCVFILLLLCFTMVAEAEAVPRWYPNHFESPSANANANVLNISSQWLNNSNTNINSNKLSQSQGQSQKQFQVQGQQQNNGQVIAPNQEMKYTEAENKRDLPGFYGYQAPDQLEYRGPYEKGIQALAKPWTLQSEWTKEQAEAFYSAADSAKCKVYPVRKIREPQTSIKVTKEGSISCILECYAESGFELWGTVAKKAMECGAKSIEEKAYVVTFANKSSGWNIGFGGGVTAVNGGNDTMGGSVGGGTGIGSVTTAPIEKVQAIFYAY